jgi:hypothetical protein
LDKSGDDMTRKRVGKPVLNEPISWFYPWGEKCLDVNIEPIPLSCSGRKGIPVTKHTLLVSLHHILL